MKRLEGKRCVVTAAAQGIGRAAAERFVAEGARVIATDVDATALDTLKCVPTAVLDVTDGDAIRDFAERTGTIDVLFNCAGSVHAGTIGPASSMTDELPVPIMRNPCFDPCAALVPIGLFFARAISTKLCVSQATSSAIRLATPVGTSIARRQDLQRTRPNCRRCCKRRYWPVQVDRLGSPDLDPPRVPQDPRIRLRAQRVGSIGANPDVRVAGMRVVRESIGGTLRRERWRDRRPSCATKKHSVTRRTTCAVRQA